MEPRFTGLRQDIRVTCLETSAAEALLHDPTNPGDLLVPGHSQVWSMGSRQTHEITVGGQPGHTIQLLEDGIDEEGPLIELRRATDENCWYLSVLNPLAKVKINGSATFPMNGAAPYRLFQGCVVSVLNTQFQVHFKQVGDPDFPRANTGPQKRKRDSVETGDACVCCKSVPATHCFFPCGHRCVCMNCSEKIMQYGKCPLCRAHTAMCKRIFCGNDVEPEAPGGSGAGGSGGSGGSGG